MTGLLLGVAIFFGLIIAVVAYISFGNLLKFFLLWTPPAGWLLVGVLCGLLLPTILGVFGVLACIFGAYRTYEAWEFSDTYSKVEKKIDEIFMSK